MNDEILIINEYPIGWGWLKDVPLIDWEWLIDVFATMTDDTDTYSYITTYGYNLCKNCGTC